MILLSGLSKGGFGAIYKSQKDLNANDRLISQDVPYMFFEILQLQE